jgi:hypothetical protein
MGLDLGRRRLASATRGGELKAMSHDSILVALINLSSSFAARSPRRPPNCPPTSSSTRAANIVLVQFPLEVISFGFVFFDFCARDAAGATARATNPGRPHWAVAARWRYWRWLPSSDRRRHRRPFLHTTTDAIKLRSALAAGRPAENLWSDDAAWGPTTPA